MKRFIMILLVAAMALTMVACGKEATSAESSVSSQVIISQKNYTDTDETGIPESASSSEQSVPESSSEEEYIEQLTPYIPEGVDLKEYIVGKWHTAFRTEERYPDNSVEELIYYYYYDFKPDGTMETSGYEMWSVSAKNEYSLVNIDGWDIIGKDAPYNLGTYTIEDNKVKIEYEGHHGGGGASAYTAYLNVVFTSDDIAVMQESEGYGAGKKNIHRYIKGDIEIETLCELLGVDTTPPPPIR